jgi:hypothetical protein
MTIRDPEVLEVLRDRPELLALADAVAETQRLPRRSRRRAVSRLSALVAVGVAALLLGLFWPGGGGGKNIVLDRALAAIGNGPVLHLVTRAPVGEQLVNLQTGRTVVPMYELESWSDQDLKRFHLIMRLNGRIVGELLFPQDRGSGTTIGPVDPAYAALWSGYRSALASGKAKIERTATLYGRPIYWLRFASSQSVPGGSLVAIDRRSYRPLAFRVELPGGRHLDSRVLLARTEPFSGAAFKRRSPRAPDPFSGSSSMESSGGQIGGSSLRLRKPWLTAGSSIAGMKLASVDPLQETSGGKRTTGVELVYGSNGDLARSITIDELKRPSEGKGIPHGFVRITQGSESQGSGTHADWTADLVRNGVYVTIDSGVSRAAVLEAARALRPV